MLCLSHTRTWGLTLGAISIPFLMCLQTMPLPHSIDLCLFLVGFYINERAYHLSKIMHVHAERRMWGLHTAQHLEPPCVAYEPK